MLGRQHQKQAERQEKLHGHRSQRFTLSVGTFKQIHEHAPAHSGKAFFSSSLRKLLLV
jgi:hypothetical protein